MIAAAGHDLRTPMTRMRLRAEFIEDEAEREKWLADLAELDSIADSAIRLVREEAQEQDEAVAELRLDRLLDDIAGELAALGYAVSQEDLPALSMRAAPLALKRALRNLIINAATHGGGAELLLSQSGDRAEIAVLDRGPGIPEPLMDRAFEPFFRIDPGRRKSIPGAGLARPYRCLWPDRAARLSPGIVRAGPTAFADQWAGTPPRSWATIPLRGQRGHRPGFVQHMGKNPRLCPDNPRRAFSDRRSAPGTGPARRCRS